MNKAFLSLGTNMGDKKNNLRNAMDMIAKQAGTIDKISSVYKTAPWGVTDQPEFYNMVVSIWSEMTAHELLHVVLNIENKMGRIRKRKMGERIIDIDILLFENKIIDEQDLKVPHPYMHQRNFVLVPLHEIAPQIVHPVLIKTIEELLQVSNDELQVNKIYFDDDMIL